MRQLLRFNESGPADLVVHLALGVAAVAAAVICLCATFDFTSGLDRIAERLSDGRIRTMFTAPVEEPCNSLTNVADVEAGAVGAGAAPRSDPGVGQPAAGSRATDLPTG